MAADSPARNPYRVRSELQCDSQEMQEHCRKNPGIMEITFQVKNGVMHTTRRIYVRYFQSVENIYTILPGVVSIGTSIFFL